MTAFSQSFVEEMLDGNAFNRHSDVKIILTMDPNKEEFHLHKVILAANSTFFRKMFYNDPRPVYEVGDISKEDFDVVIAAMYGRGEFLAGTNSLMKTLDYLGCDKIKSQILEGNGFLPLEGCFFLVGYSLSKLKVGSG